MCDLTANPQALQGFVLIVFAAIALVAIALWELHDFLTSDRLRQQSRANQIADQRRREMATRSTLSRLRNRKSDLK